MTLIVVIIIVLLAVTLHEAMHGYTSSWLGDDTAHNAGRLTLNPLAHIDPFATILLPLFLFFAGLPVFGAAKPVPFNPYNLRYGDFGAAMVAISGPLTNLGLALLGALAIRITGYDSAAIGLLALFVSINLGFFIFNMIPLPPLDGSRVLYAFAPPKVQEVMQMMERHGLIVVAVMIVFFSQFIGPAIITAISTLFELIVGIPFTDLL